jgi:hypothetical protein
MRLVLLLVVAGCRTQPLETTPPRDLAPLVDLAPAVDAGCDGGLNACGACGPTPDEVCNGRDDDDCDGFVDEGCAHRLDPGQSIAASRVRLAGERAVYSGGTSLPYGSQQTEVWAVDLRDGSHRLLASAPGVKPDGTSGFVGSGDTDGTWAVWIRQTGNDVALEAASLETSATRTHAFARVHPLNEPSIVDGRVVWSDGARAASWSLADDRVETITLPRPAVGLRRDGDWLLTIVDVRPLAVEALRIADGKVIALATGDNVDGLDVDGARAVSDLGHRRRWLSAGAARRRPGGGDVGGAVRRPRRLRLASRGSSCDVAGRRVAWISTAAGDGLVFVRELAPSEP